MSRDDATITTSPLVPTAEIQQQGQDPQFETKQIQKISIMYEEIYPVIQY